MNKTTDFLLFISFTTCLGKCFLWLFEQARALILTGSEQVKACERVPIPPGSVFLLSNYFLACFSIDCILLITLVEARDFVRDVTRNFKRPRLSKKKLIVCLK